MMEPACSLDLWSMIWRTGRAGTADELAIDKGLLELIRLLIAELNPKQKTIKSKHKEQKPFKVSLVAVHFFAFDSFLFKFFRKLPIQIDSFPQMCLFSLFIISFTSHEAPCSCSSPSVKCTSLLSCIPKWCWMVHLGIPEASPTKKEQKQGIS